MDIDRAVGLILAKRGEVLPGRSVLVGITGIDGCGKTHVTPGIVLALQGRGVRAAGIGADAWLNLPHVRFSTVNPATHFYQHALRLDELFAALVLPLRERRSLRLVADVAEETATTFRKHTYEFHDVDVIVLEGIYLLKKKYRAHFDLSFWIDCTFETALERALRRAQEGLSRDETMRAFETVYFPAQRIHFATDDPRAAATAVIVNDPRIATRTCGWRTE